ncbi:MAG: heme exporter protein CcmB [Parvibaculum sp.]|nr:heme exporter protein CcmB [Parvibaculum sp.]
MKRAFVSLVRRDVALAVQVGGGGGMAVFFFFVTVALLPLGIGPNLNLLGQIAPGLLWVALLLSSLLTLDRLFQADFEDGTLDVLSMATLPLELTVVAKVLSHWLTTGLPLVVAAPFLGLLLNLSGDQFLPLVSAMLIGTPALSLMGAVGAALTVSVRRGGLLASLLVIPFYIPVLIFGVAAASSNVMPAVSTQAIALLGAVTLMSFVVGPWAAAAALRANLKT